MDRTVVLITGCSSGIGLHLALRLASDPSRSFKVYATLRDLRAQDPLWEAARSRGCPPGSLETLQLDVRDADSVAAARARVTEGRVDVLVCNAGRGLLGPLEAHTAGAVGSVLDVNVAGTVRTLQAFLPDMKRRRSGRVLVTGSMGGLMGAWMGRGQREGRDLVAVPPAAWGSRWRPSQTRLRSLFSPRRAAVQRGLLRQQVRDRRSVRESGGSPASLRGPREPHRVRPGAHRLPGEAGGRRGRGAGRRGRRDPPPLLPLPAPSGADLPRGGAGPGRGDRGLPRRAARPAPRAALLQHRELPAPGAPASGRPQRLQLRRRHAPRGVRRRARGGADRRCPRRPRAPRSSRRRRPAIKAWSAAVCRSLLCAPGMRGSAGRRQAAGCTAPVGQVARASGGRSGKIVVSPGYSCAETEAQKEEEASPRKGRAASGPWIPTGCLQQVLGGPGKGESQVVTCPHPQSWEIRQGP
ncbi:estradiol 17-beta-dehydrogenase 1 isoform X1 [Enhydra lutris kenyoni]|uniref:Estradiol 17-beta-dehydrogenase 1 isoform X1 n=1 Tax=Enhydra lutris kenyoni TaxID=391180 RepID=A0A2Y9JW38_ENHLU|nr:estradiol 17-beta-dehydrogenase 1 isoform X1 [Enhydra lutris kenyoni]